MLLLLFIPSHFSSPLTQGRRENTGEEESGWTAKRRKGDTAAECKEAKVRTERGAEREWYARQVGGTEKHRMRQNEDSSVHMCSEVQCRCVSNSTGCAHRRMACLCSVCVSVSPRPRLHQLSSHGQHKHTESWFHCLSKVLHYRVSEVFGKHAGLLLWIM